MEVKVPTCSENGMPAFEPTPAIFLSAATPPLRHTSAVTKQRTCIVSRQPMGFHTSRTMYLLNRRLLTQRGRTARRRERLRKDNAKLKTDIRRIKAVLDEEGGGDET